MTKKSTQSLRMGKYCEQAFGLVASYLSAHMSLLPKDELARINKAIIDDLLGEAGPSYRPVPKDARRSALMYCITDIATHLLYLHYHAEMIKRNPHKGKIPDGDYINIVVHSFDETCYIVHERMRKMYDLLEKMQRVSERLTEVSEVVFKKEKRRKAKDSTVFDMVLSARGTHVHNVSVDRPEVPRLTLLELFGKFPEPELKQLVALELRSQLKASRAKNALRFASSIELVELAAERFFEAALPELKGIFCATVTKAS